MDLNKVKPLMLHRILPNIAIGGASGIIGGINTYDMLSSEDKKKLKEKYGLNNNANIITSSIGRGLVGGLIGGALGGVGSIGISYIGKKIMERQLAKGVYNSIKHKFDNKDKFVKNSVKDYIRRLINKRNFNTVEELIFAENGNRRKYIDSYNKAMTTGNITRVLANPFGIPFLGSGLGVYYSLKKYLPDNIAEK